MTGFSNADQREASHAEVTQGAAMKRNGTSLCQRKSCCHIIAITQAGIAAPALTVMQGFQAKKDCSMHFLFHSCKLRLYSVSFPSKRS